MKHKIFVFTILVSFSLLSFAETFYEDLNPAQRYDLSQAYLSISEHFKEMGQEKRGKAYKAISEQISASISKETATEQTPGEKEVAGESKENKTGTGEVDGDAVDNNTKTAVMYWFKKFTKTAFSGAGNKASEIMSFPVRMKDKEIDKDRFINDIKLANEIFDLESKEASDIWKMKSADFEKTDSGIVLILKPEENLDFLDTKQLIFWSDPQRFLFVKDGNSWKIAEIY